MSTRVALRTMDKAEKEIAKLDRAVKGAIWDFHQKFRENPNHSGLQLKQLQGSKLFSARVNREYRAILAPVGDNAWLLLTVAHRRESYADLDRFTLDVNRVTGGIEFVDVVAIEDSINLKRSHSAPANDSSPLFAHVDADDLRSLGVVEVLLPLIFKLSTEDELLGLVEYAPALTGEVLLGLYDGRTIDQVREQIVQPQAAETPVDTEDLQEALARPATVVSTDDTALIMALQDDFIRWKVFLHPTQRKLVERDYSGPARVSGGPGTGKTVVALHRVRHLAAALPERTDRPILLTTYARNLAVDLSAKLVQLGGADIAGRVDVINIDRLAHQIVNEVERGKPRMLISDSRALSEWRELLTEVGESKWDADFLATEWSQIILGQLCASFSDYAQARRAGRGRSLTRSDRKQVWQLTERFSKRMEEKGFTTHGMTAALAARIVRANQLGQKHRYRHVVVDEAQDLRPAHWMMLRAMVQQDRNDIFAVGDTHQRIYDNVVTLSSLGVNIRGRSAKLTLNYRTSRQILGSALALLRGETFDDLDGGLDSLVGYRSVLQGNNKPELRQFSTWARELDGVVNQLKQWQNETHLDAMAVCVPTNELVADTIARLREDEIPVIELTPDGPKGTDGVQIGTMHRFKGLEFQRLIIAGATDGLVPMGGIDRWRDTDPPRYQRELRRNRSLLFVAATRARDDLAIFWHGKKSRFLP